MPDGVVPAAPPVIKRTRSRTKFHGERRYCVSREAPEIAGIAKEPIRLLSPGRSVELRVLFVCRTEKPAPAVTVPDQH
jgi:hypothetical protein